MGEWSRGRGGETEDCKESKDSKDDDHQSLMSMVSLKSLVSLWSLWSLRSSLPSPHPTAANPGPAASPAATTGNQIRNTVPRPTSLSTSMRPPRMSTSRRTM